MGGGGSIASLYTNRALSPSGWPAPDCNWEVSPRVRPSCSAFCFLSHVTTKMGKGHVHFSLQVRERPSFQMKETRSSWGSRRPFI